MCAPKGRRERERGLDELRVRVLRLRRSDVLLAIDDVRVLAHRRRHAGCGLIMLFAGDQACWACRSRGRVSCASSCKVDVVTADGTLAGWKPKSVVDTSTPRLTALSPRTASRLEYPSACDGMLLGTAATGSAISRGCCPVVELALDVGGRADRLKIETKHRG